MLVREIAKMTAGDLKVTWSNAQDFVKNPSSVTGTLNGLRLICAIDDPYI